MDKKDRIARALDRLGNNLARKIGFWNIPVNLLPSEIINGHKTPVKSAEYNGKKYRVTLMNDTRWEWVHQGHQGQPWKISKV